MTINDAIDGTLPSPFKVGSTSVTSTGTQLNLLNDLTLVPITKINTQLFQLTAEGPYVPTAGMRYCIIELVGDGGGSGGTTGAPGESAMSGAGGGGGYLRILADATNIGASAAISIGTGGAAGASGNNNGSDGAGTTITINGSVWTAEGGRGGTGQASSASAQLSSNPGGGGGGIPGLHATIVLNLGGGIGGIGYTAAAAGVIPVLWPNGGVSMYSPYALVINEQGIGYGGGASGFWNISAMDQAGKEGAPGVIIITEYISA